MATKKFSEYAIEGNNITLTYDNVNDTVTFDVNVDKNDVGLGNVDNTSDVNKPISTATQTALDGKASTTSLNAHISDINNPHNVTKSQVGLGNVDNTSDVNKPISSATQTALNAKQDSLGFTPVANTRTLTINGIGYDLSLDRSWNVGDLLSTGSYSNPTWLTSLAWGKISGTPTTLSGYGITDAVPSSRTLTINGTAYDLSADRSWTISTPTLAQVTTAGNTTTNAITIGALTVATNLISTDIGNSRVGIGTTSPSYKLEVIGTPRFSGGSSQGAIFGAGTVINLASDAYMLATSTSGKNAGYTINRFSTSEYASFDLLTGANGASGWSIQMRPSSTRLDIVDRISENIRMTFFNGGNIAINSTTDAGYKLDVNGSTRIKGTGTTSSTYSLFVQNSAGTNLLTITDSGNFGTTTSNFSSVVTNNSNSFQVTGGIAAIRVGGSISVVASAILQADSTTQGFLPPRMTTTQKNAISTPAAGLVVYDTTLNKLCVYTSAWETITSI